MGHHVSTKVQSGNTPLNCRVLSQAPLPSRRQAKPLRGFCGARTLPTQPPAELPGRAGPTGSVLPLRADVWAGERPPARAEAPAGGVAVGTCTAGLVVA